jgi:hypothetical protein
MLRFEGIKDGSSHEQISKSTNDQRQSPDVLSLHSSSLMNPWQESRIRQLSHPWQTSVNISLTSDMSTSKRREQKNTLKEINRRKQMTRRLKWITRTSQWPWLLIWIVMRSLDTRGDSGGQSINDCRCTWFGLLHVLAWWSKEVTPTNNVTFNVVSTTDYKLPKWSDPRDWHVRHTPTLE